MGTDQRVPTFVATSLLLVALASGAGAQSVEVDVADDVDFSGFQTYAWRGGTPAPSPLVQRRIVQAIDEELQARGLEQVDVEGDLYVTTFAVIDQKTRRRAVNLGVGVTRRTRRGSISVGGSSGGRPRQVTTGTLIIDVFESAGETMIWQAISSATLGSDPQKNSVKTLEAIETSFAQFPVAREQRRSPSAQGEESD